MNKITCTLILIGVITLSACGTTHYLHDKVADLELQKKQLANGNTVYIDYNVTPTPLWQCQQIGQPQRYNWAALRTQGQFSLYGSNGLLIERALSYANNQNLKINYINLKIPTEKTFSTGSERSTTSFNLDTNAQAVAVYYQCRLINPEHKIGWNKKENFSVFVGK